MIQLHPEFLSKNGNREFAVLPYEEFIKIRELLEDLVFKVCWKNIVNLNLEMKM